MEMDKDLSWSMKYVKEKFKSRDKELKKQAKEYERRLNELNHENARILSAQDKSVSVDKFEGAIKQFEQKLENVVVELRTDILNLKEFKQKSEGKSTGYSQFIGWILFIIAVVAFVVQNMKFK